MPLPINAFGAYAPYIHVVYRGGVYRVYGVYPGCIQEGVYRGVYRGVQGYTDTGYGIRILDTGYRKRILETGYWIPDTDTDTDTETGYRNTEYGYRNTETGY